MSSASKSGISQEFLPATDPRPEVEDVRDSDAHATNARLPSALLRIQGDAVQDIHGGGSLTGCWFGDDLI